MADELNRPEEPGTGPRSDGEIDAVEYVEAGTRVRAMAERPYEAPRRRIPVPDTRPPGAQALVDQKTEAIKAKAPEVVTALGDFYDSLTPAQQQKVRDFMQRRGGWHRG